MSIKLKTVEWSGMFSYGDNNKLDLTKNVITQVDAPNGSGKTAIVLILQELMFSKNMKGIKKGDIVNRFSGSDSWTGSLTFEADEKEYKINVIRKGDTSKVSLTENGKSISEHKIPDTYKKLLTIYKASVEVLNQLMYQSSTSQLEFLRATDTNRKKFLVSLFNVEKYLAYGEVIKLKISELEKTMATYRGEEKTVKDFLSQTSMPLEKKTKVVIPNVDESLKDEIRSLEQEIAQYNSACAAIDKNNLLKQERLSIKFAIDLQDIDQAELETAKSNLSKLQVNSSTILREIEKDQKELKNLNTATHCYACKQPIDNSQSIAMVERLQASVDKNHEQLKEIQNQTVEAKRVVDGLESKHKAFMENLRKIERFEQLSSLINKDLPDNYPDVANSKQVLTQKKLELEQQIKSQADAIKYNNDVDILNAKVETIVNQKREFLARQELITSDIINLQSKIDRLTTLRKAFSTTGIVAFELENIIKEFEKEINEYLVELSDGQFQISFRLEGEKLNIVVFSSGMESPIENASEGEFSRIQTATLLAIRKLLTKMGGVQINFLFLDEVMGVLDQSGKEKLIEILQKEENTNTFLVAHGFSHPLVPKLEIVKENNIARIV